MWYQGSWRILPNRGHELSVADRTILQSVRPANTNRPLETEVAASMRSNPPLKLPAQLSGIALACNQPASGDPGALTLKEEKMRKFVLAAALFVSLCVVATAGPKEDALEVLEKWSKAFSASDVDGIVKLYAVDTTFMGTGSKTVVVKSEEIRKYFEQALLNNRPRSAKLNTYSATVLSDTAVLFTGLDTVTGVRDGTPFSADGRVTFVVAKRSAEWQIVHFHRSAMPK
jgi:uncharacterized protein (TIGR02246 family)